MSLIVRVLFAVAVALIASPSFGQYAKPAELEQVFIDALGSAKMLSKGEYKAVRSVMSAYFEKKYDAEIRAGFDKDYEEIAKFLKDNPEIRDTLFTALNAEDDQFEDALKIFRELYKLGPDKMKSHANLAIAICVVWDNPKATTARTNGVPAATCPSIQ